LRYPGAGPAFPDHHIIYKGAIVFLAMNPTQYGYTLVAPKEQVAGDFTVEEYLDLQRVVHRVAETVREEVGAERMHVLSIGSNQSNAHVPLARRAFAPRHPL
jgi:diadenosine tetraphosphate (Ap4A) HIT family hydrolase